MDFLRFFSNQDKIKYLLLIAFVWIFLSYAINTDFNLNFIVKVFIIGIIFYFIINLDLTKKKQTENNLSDKFKLLQNYSLHIKNNKEFASSKNATHFLSLQFIEKDTDAILFYSKYLDYRNLVNYRAFNQSLLHYNQFLKIKQDLLNGIKTNYKQINDLLLFEKNNCLNEFSSLNISFETQHINYKWENLIIKDNNKFENALNELETLFKNHLDQINNFLEKKYYSEPITQNSYPKLYIDDNLSGNIEKTKNYSDNFTLYY